jgi:hypothetical protein
MADYIPNDEAAAIAENLIEKFHPRLIGLKIAHLLRIMPVPKKSKTPKPQRVGKKVVLAKASKVSSKTAALAAEDFKFVIEYGSLYWDKMEDKDKIALVDHELCHCGNDADGTYTLPHTLEEFKEIIDRYGFWKDDIKQFAEAIEGVYHKVRVTA